VEYTGFSCTRLEAIFGNRAQASTSILYDKFINSVQMLG